MESTARQAYDQAGAADTCHKTDPAIRFRLPVTQGSLAESSWGAFLRLEAVLRGSLGRNPPYSIEVGTRSTLTGGRSASRSIPSRRWTYVTCLV